MSADECASELARFQTAYKLSRKPGGVTAFRAKYLFPMVSIYGRKIPMHGDVSIDCLQLLADRDGYVRVREAIGWGKRAFSGLVLADILKHLAFGNDNSTHAYYEIESDEEIAEILLSTFLIEAAKSEKARSSACGDRVWFLRDRFLVLTKFHPVIATFRAFRVWPESGEILRPGNFFQHTVALLTFPDSSTPIVLDAVLSPAISRMTIEEWADSSLLNAGRIAELPLDPKVHKVWAPQEWEIKLPRGIQ